MEFFISRFLLYLYETSFILFEDDTQAKIVYDSISELRFNCLDKYS